MSFRDVQAATEAAIANAHAARLLAYLARRTNVGDAEHYCGRYQVRDIVEDYAKSGHQRSERAIRGDLAYLRKWPAINTKIAKCQKTGHDRGLLIWLLLPFTPHAPGASPPPDKPAPKCSLMGDVNLNGCAYPETNKEQDPNKEHLEQKQTASGFEDSPLAITTSSGADQEPRKIEDSEQEQDLLKSCAKKGSVPSSAPIAPAHLTPRRVFDHTKALIAYHGHGEDPTPWTHDMTVQVCHVRNRLHGCDIHLWDAMANVLGNWKTFRAYLKPGMSAAAFKKTVGSRPTADLLFKYWGDLFRFYMLPSYQVQALAETGKKYVPKPPAWMAAKAVTTA